MKFYDASDLTFAFIFGIFVGMLIIGSCWAGKSDHEAYESWRLETIELRNQ